MADARLSPLLHDLLAGGIGVRLRVTGLSMSPGLTDDDLVTLVPVENAGIRLGDLVYAEMPGQPPRLHRVVARSRAADGRPLFQTKGDALLGPDPPVCGSFILGRVARIQRYDRSGAPREIRLEARGRRIVQFALAIASRHAPRAFTALSRCLAPGNPLVR